MPKNNKNNKKQQHQQDQRFKKDQRFKPTKKQNKKKLDERFSKKINSNLFKEKVKIDKYGRKIEEDNDLNEITKNYEMDDKEINENEIEKEDNEIDDEVEIEMNEGVKEQFEEQENIPRGDATKRIAIVNCDWETITAQNLYALLHTQLPEEGKLLNVSIYPSEFGIERMHLEEVEGMPKSLWKEGVEDLVEVIEDKNLMDPNWKPTFTVISDEKLKEVNPDLEVKEEELDEMSEEDNDEDLDLKPVNNQKGEISKAEFIPIDLLDEEKMAQYEKDKLKYYYAVAEFDSVETANYVYEQVDGEELEFCQESLDLRFVPDELEFPYKAVDVCTKYMKVFGNEGKIKSNKIKISWDTDAQRRKNILRKNFTEIDEEKILNNEELYREFIEHSSDYEDNLTKKDEADIIRKKYSILLGDDDNEMEEDDANNLKEGEMMMKFSSNEFVEEKEKKQKKDKKQIQKEKEELELIMMDDITANKEKKMKKTLAEEEEEKEEIQKTRKNRKGKKKKTLKEKVDKNFVIDTTDERFKKMLNSSDFDIDKSNPEYIETRALSRVISEKKEIFKQKQKELKRKHNEEN